MQEIKQGIEILPQAQHIVLNSGGARYVIAIDQGTSSSRVIVYNQQAKLVSVAQRKLSSHYPQAGWVEQDALEIWDSVREMLVEAKVRAGISWDEIAAVGITNQRETVVLWDKWTGLPVAPAIVWQCRRTAEFCQSLKEAGYEALIRERTGLPIDAYFSASKLRWLFENDPALRGRAERGELLAGTVDAWLIWKLSAGESHVTDVSNASRTQLLNIHNLKWDPELLRLFEIPPAVLPTVVSSSGALAEFVVSTVDAATGAGVGVDAASGLASASGLRIPISGVAGDQQAALFGQCCFEPGMVKSTYGTGCFLLVNTGRKALSSKSSLLTTLAWDLGDGPIYALEGSVFNAGSAVQWLRDELGLIPSAAACDLEAAKVSSTDGLYFVPAFTGLGAPHWEMRAKGMVLGLTRSSNKAQLCRATLESVAFQTAELCLAMERDLGFRLSELRVDGGLANSDVLLQFQADLLDLVLVRPSSVETTALGAAFLAGLGVGFWQNCEQLRRLAPASEAERFEPSASEDWRSAAMAGWQRAVAAVLFDAASESV